ncbi:MAG: AmmeMemoRadiSam system protein B [Asgard group archaeon]|nr:AmmeMemoRadiSam system protein B [Asgard group archaeon]
MIRSAQYAGSFYANRPDDLLASLKHCFKGPFGPQKLPEDVEKIEKLAPFLLVPHAGYIYSGPVAAWSYLELSKFTHPDTVIILGPNHTGFGAEIGVPKEVSVWSTPFGDVEIDHTIIDKMVNISKHISKNDLSHAREHSIEVQLPFLQFVLSEPFKLVPISLLNQGLDTAILLGEILSDICLNENVVVIASSDFSHYESHEIAKSKDSKVLKAIEKLDIKEMYDTKYSQNVSMCGHGPIGATIEAAKKTNRTKSKILSYATSGDVSGMKNQVVGYSAAAFYKE